MLIQWYPGHMAKARRMLQENLKLVDAVAEIVDARAPEASRNPDFDALFSGKARLILLNKADLADENMTRRFVEYYKGKGFLAAPIVSTGAAGKKQAVSLMERAVADKVKRMEEKGVKKTVRVMVVGIPNVGKSTFINRVAGENRAKTGDTPGVTRSKQWVKVDAYLELMDSPGLLWPKLEDQDKALSLAFLGSINDDILDGEELSAAGLLEHMAQASAARSGYRMRFVLNLPVSIGYIGQVKKYSISRLPKKGEELTTTVHLVQDFFNVSMTDVEVRVGDELIARASLKSAQAS